MNQDNKTTADLAKLSDLRLSESARLRIKDNLQAYTTFHAVREPSVNRSIEQVPLRTSLFPLKFLYMPFIILLALMIGGGTSFAAQGALPGDFLYPVKTEFNESIRAAFALSADSEAKLQADLLEERIAEATELQAEGKLTADTAQSVAANITLQTTVAMTASANSSVVVAKETKSQIQGALTSFLAIANLDSKLTADISASVMTSTLSTGEYDISSYKADTTARTNALAVIVEKNKSQLQSGEYINLNLKIVAASKLAADAATQADADARVTLDKAATLAGEVEAKLSTLGQVEIDPNTGIITDIDFSIDPMMIDRGDGSGNGVPTDPRAAESRGAAGAVKIEANVKESRDSDAINTSVESDMSVQSNGALDI